MTKWRARKFVAIPAAALTLILVLDVQIAHSQNNPGLEGWPTRAIESGGVDIKDSPGHVPGVHSFSSTIVPQESSANATALSAPSPTLTYTCDATINALVGVCNTLNTTIAALYTRRFTNLNVSIYISFGSTALGLSNYAINPETYTAFRNALNASQTDNNDVIAFSSSVPATNPINPTYSVWLTNANARALGFAASWGLESDGMTFCVSGTTGCYDGIITISSSEQSAGHFFFRSGSIGQSQFDFYSIAEHETDEVLGTASCAIAGCGSAIHPTDLYRYQSNGARSFAAGNNSSCASSTSGNACFSIDGVHMLQQYNNLANGQDSGDWVTNCAAQLVQDAALCAGVAGVDISLAAELLVLDVIGYNLTAPQPEAVLRDTSNKIRLSTYPSPILSNAGGAFASDPSAAEDPAGNVFVAARDGSNAVWTIVFDPVARSWGTWALGGGSTVGLPAIAVVPNGTAWVAARDSSNAYWLLSYTTAAGYGSWVPLHGSFTTDPVIAACGDGTIYVVGKDSSNALWSGHYIPGTGFQNFVFFGGAVAGNPAVSCGNDNAIYIVAQDSFHSNWMARVTGNTWTGWTNGGAGTSIDPRIAALGGSLAVVILDAGGSVWWNTFTEAGNNWQSWTNVGGGLQDVSPAGVAGELFLIGRAANGLWWWRQTGSEWTWIGNSGVAAGALAAAPR
jgi:hypothetical protein